MNDVTVFENSVLGSIRVVVKEDEPWFVVADVCKVLDLTNPTVAISNLDEDEKAKSDLGYGSPANVINESGLYALIVRSDKPEAKRFRKWVTKEVLPSIRKTGKYEVNPQQSIENTVAQAESMLEVDKMKNKMEIQGLQLEIQTIKTYIQTQRIKIRDLEAEIVKKESEAELMEIEHAKKIDAVRNFYTNQVVITVGKRK